MAFHWFGEQSLFSHQLFGIFYITSVVNFVLVHLDLYYKHVCLCRSRTKGFYVIVIISMFL